MKIIRKVEELRNAVMTLKAQGRSIGLVPTMGALHDGHVSLVNRARKENDVVVASVFVNPTQFNNPDDLRTYPRTEEADCRRLSDAGVDIAFIPTVEEVYPEPDTRVFDLGPVAEVMEGAMRPGHFNGVAQVVSRLFDYVRPTRAYFGEKDFQQISVIRRMVELEGFNIDIVACPIMRHPDGLAMSSRNVRLTPHQRAIAPAISRILSESMQLRRNGASVKEVTDMVTHSFDSIPEMEIEYFTIANVDDMQPITDWDQAPNGAVGCITVYLGDVRLIDNIKYQ